MLVNVAGDVFATRHIGSSDAEVALMLSVVGATDLDEFIDRVVPNSIRSSDQLAVPAARTEVEVVARLREFADRNVVATSLIGAGYYGTVVPAVLQRNVLENPAWYTAYTPYQPGPVGGVTELPDHGVRSDRARIGERLAARRSDGRGRSDGACSSCGSDGSRQVLR
jgi:glycine cleavage system pyridoxal-binding protein P